MRLNALDLAWAVLGVAVALVVLWASRWCCACLRQEIGQSFGPPEVEPLHGARVWFLIWFGVSAAALVVVLPLPEGVRFVWLLWLALLGLLGLIDAQMGLLPNELTLLLLISGLLWQGPALAHGLPPPQYVWGCLLGWALPFGTNALYQWRHQACAIGQGDAKLLAGLGAWLGVQALPLIWLVACAGVLVYTAAVWVLTRRRQSCVTFGPFLMIGATAAMILKYA